MNEPFTVTFTITPGEVWIDPDNVAWYARQIINGAVYLERTEGTNVDPKELVRTWRKMGD